MAGRNRRAGLRGQELGAGGDSPGGVPLAGKLARQIEELEGIRVPVGAIDIALYRDDASTALPKPEIGRSEIPFEVEGRRIVLVDDVLYTGRTVRAALDALLDYGRPQKIELAVLVDRGGRELPIQPDFVVKVAEVHESERIEVQVDDRRALQRWFTGEAHDERTRDLGAPPSARNRGALRRGRDADSRHGRGIFRGLAAARAQGADAARQDGHQPVLRGVDAHPHLVRDCWQEALGRRRSTSRHRARA